MNVSALCFLLSALVLTGCASFHSAQVESVPTGTNVMTKTTRVTIFSFFDSHNDVTKLKTTATDKTQGISVGAISENTSGTNTVELLRVVGGILQNIPK